MTEIDNALTSEMVDRLREMFREKRYAEVLDECVAFESAGTISEDIAVLHGAALGKLRRFDEAIEYLLKSIERFPASARLYQNLGIVYLKKNRLRDAWRAFSKARADDPLVGRKVNKAILVMVALLAAIAVYVILIIIFWPQSRYYSIPLFLFIVASLIRSLVILLKRKKVAGAFLVLIVLLVWMVIALGVVLPGCEIHLGGIRIVTQKGGTTVPRAEEYFLEAHGASSSGQPAEALRLVEEAIRLDPAYAKAYERMGYYSELLARKAKKDGFSQDAVSAYEADALAAYKKAAELDSTNVPYLEDVADYCIDLKKLPEAEFYLEKIVRLMPGSEYFKERLREVRDAQGL